GGYREDRPLPLFAGYQRITQTEGERAMEHRLAMIGFGTVGQALARILMERKAELREKEGYMARITAISDAMKGALYHPEGLDLVQVFRSLEQTGTLDAYPDTPGLKRGWDSLKTIEDTNADVV